MGAAALVDNDNQIETESWDNDIPEVQYHQFPLPYNTILLVDTEKKFEQFLRYIKVSKCSNIAWKLQYDVYCIHI